MTKERARHWRAFKGKLEELREELGDNFLVAYPDRGEEISSNFLDQDDCWYEGMVSPYLVWYP